MRAWSAAALILAAASLWLAVRNTDTGQALDVLRQLPIWFVLASLGPATGALAARALRWKVVVGTGGPLSFSTALWATALGSLGNSYLPARAGEALRLMATCRAKAGSLPYLLAATIGERLLDAATLVLVAFVALAATPQLPPWLRQGAGGMFAVTLLGLVFVYVLPPGPIVPWQLLPAAAAAFLNRVAAGLQLFRDAARLRKFALYTVVAWVLDIGGSVMLAQVMHLPLTWSAAAVLIAALGLASAVPSTPGAIGISQFVAISILTPYGFTRAHALAFILAAQATTYLSVTLWGLLALWHLRGQPETRASIEPDAAIGEQRLA